MTVSDLRRRMTQAELVEWIAYYQIEPFGPRRDDYRAGTVAATVYNVNRTKRGKPADWESFMGKQRRPRRRSGPGRSATELRSMLEAIIPNPNRAHE